MPLLYIQLPSAPQTFRGKKAQRFQTKMMYVLPGLASRSRGFFLGVRVEKLCLPESRVEVGVEKICSTLTPNLSQEWKAFYAMNKLPKCNVGLGKSRPARVLQIS